MISRNATSDKKYYVNYDVTRIIEIRPGGVVSGPGHRALDGQYLISIICSVYTDLRHLPEADGRVAKGNSLQLTEKKHGPSALPDPYIGVPPPINR